jgi:hypothetical protein
VRICARSTVRFLSRSPGTSVSLVYLVLRQVLGPTRPRGRGQGCRTAGAASPGCGASSAGRPSPHTRPARPPAPSMPPDAGCGRLSESPWPAPDDGATPDTAIGRSAWSSVNLALTADRLTPSDRPVRTSGCVSGRTCSATATTSPPKPAVTRSPSGCFATPGLPPAAPPTGPPPTRHHPGRRPPGRGNHPHRRRPQLRRRRLAHHR